MTIGRTPPVGPTIPRPAAPAVRRAAAPAAPAAPAAAKTSSAAQAPSANAAAAAELWDALDDEERAFFLQRAAHGPATYGPRRPAAAPSAAPLGRHLDVRA